MKFYLAYLLKNYLGIVGDGGSVTLIQFADQYPIDYIFRTNVLLYLYC